MWADAWDLSSTESVDDVKLQVRMISCCGKAGCLIYLHAFLLDNPRI